MRAGHAPLGRLWYRERIPVPAVREKRLKRRRIAALGAAVVLVWLCGSSAGSELRGLKGRIVFCSNRSGTWALWTIGADGTGLRQLTRSNNGEKDVDPAFSPDGKQVLFTSTRGGKTGVWMMGADGARLKRLCDGGQAEWSADGQSIVFARNDRIHTRGLVDGKETAISPEDWLPCSGPAWSPDGKTIAFAARSGGKNALYLVAATGGKPTKVYDKRGACEPHWSPDGTQLLYETETHVCRIRPDGTKNRYVTVHAGVQRYPRWSPDGRHVVFCQGVSERGPWQLYTVPARGGAPVKLTDRGSDMYPDWK